MGDFSLTFSNTQTHAHRAALQAAPMGKSETNLKRRHFSVGGRSHGQSSQLAASDLIQIVVRQVRASVGTPRVPAGKDSCL